MTAKCSNKDDDTDTGNAPFTLVEFKREAMFIRASSANGHTAFYVAVSCEVDVHVPESVRHQ